MTVALQRNSDRTGTQPELIYSSGESGVQSLPSTRAKIAADVAGDPRWKAVLARDSASDGKFFFSVKSTGVYCRPSCASRRARPENVQFHASAADAEAAGFRPCQRCRPNEASRSESEAALVATACRSIEHAESEPKLSDLAKQAGLSPFHFHRIFRSVTGLTPKQYAVGHRAERVRRSLNHATTVTEAIYDAGYNSSSRFYEKSSAMLGMTPSRFRSGGLRTEIRYALAECSLGCILVAQSERGICAISFGDEPSNLVRELHERFPRAKLASDRAFQKTVASVVEFVEKPAAALALPLDIQGTAFQQRVWQALRQIPIGTTATYSEIARKIGKPRAIRAVAGACAANSLAIAIPCHRVIGSDGKLSGYRWGINRKRILLARETQT